VATGAAIGVVVGDGGIHGAATGADDGSGNGGIAGEPKPPGRGRLCGMSDGLVERGKVDFDALGDSAEK